eukprot:SAG22_NODE_11760_length_470_cov_1.191375_1_plen_83_part_10
MGFLSKTVPFGAVPLPATGDDDETPETELVHKHIVFRAWRYLVTVVVVGALVLCAVLISGVALFFKADGAMDLLATEGSAGVL